MHRSRRKIIFAGLMGAGFSLLGCGSSPTYSQRPSRERYVEEISSVLISADEKTIVAMSERYHYVFEAPARLVATLKSGFHKKIQGDLRGFFVDQFGVTTGEYVLVLEAPSERDRVEAVAAGYVLDAAGRLSVKGELKGKRYSAKKEVRPVANYQLNRTYRLEIDVEKPAPGHEQASASPVSNGPNGLLLIAAVPLVVLFLLLGGCSGQRCH